MCRRAQCWGPSTGRGDFPSQVPSALGLGHQTHAVYTGREGSSSAREGTRQCTQIRRPIWERPGVHCTLVSRKRPRASKSYGARCGAARLTCEARHERAEPEQTGVEGRGHPRHGARRSAGARGGDGAGPRPGTAAACRALRSGSRRPRPGWPAPRRHHRPRWPAGTPGVVTFYDVPSPSPRASALGAPSLLLLLPAPNSSLLSPPLSPAGRHSVSLRLGGTGRGELRAGPAPPCAGTRQHA